MITNTFVTITPLKRDVNTSLYEYFDNIVPFYSYLFRRTFHHIKNGLTVKESVYRTALMNEFNITNRFAKVLIREAKNRLKLLIEGLKWQFNNIPLKIRDLQKRISKTKSRLNNEMNPIKRKHLKEVLWRRQVKLNRLKQRLANGFRLKTTFGSTKLFKTDITAFKLKRDNQLVYIGDKNETNGNQQFQLQFDSRRNVFTYKCRLEDAYQKDDKYIYGEFIIRDKVAKKAILNTLRTVKSNPLSFRLIRNDDQLNLQIMYKYSVSETTRDSHGVLGIDFNKGFITLSEIDRCGNLMKTHKIKYLHKGKTTKTHHSLTELVSKVSNLAISLGKDVVIEDLKSLNRRKNTKKSKPYNAMLNTLKFGKFNKLLTAKANKYGFTVHKINPYNTSIIGKEKYADNLKLNGHTAASYVIARRHYKYD